MNMIKQGILIATVGFVTSLLVTYLIDGMINWMISSGVASGFLFGSLVIYFWQKDAEKTNSDKD